MSDFLKLVPEFFYDVISRLIPGGLFLYAANLSGVVPFYYWNLDGLFGDAGKTVAYAMLAWSVGLCLATSSAVLESFYWILARHYPGLFPLYQALGLAPPVKCRVRDCTRANTFKPYDTWQVPKKISALLDELKLHDYNHAMVCWKMDAEATFLSNLGLGCLLLSTILVFRDPAFLHQRFLIWLAAGEVLILLSMVRRVLFWARVAAARGHMNRTRLFALERNTIAADQPKS